MNGRIPSLDGARAVSISAVIASHLLTGSGLPVVWRLHFLGSVGVRTFFVISGFIITTLILEELERSDRISLTDFYVRRAARILPAYWVYVGAVVLLIPTGLVAARYADLPAVLAYFSNYHLPGLALGHTWSLSVEEQFYLLWPITLLLAGTKKGRVACIALIVVAPGFRVLSDVGLWSGQHSYAFECVCDSLAAGCLLAILRTRLWNIPIYRRFIGSSYVLPTLAAILMFMIVRTDTLTSDLAFSLLNFAIAAALDRYMRFPSSTTGRLLNTGPFVWVGTISYGLYLWQQLFTFSELPVVVKIAAPVCISAASFYLVEAPIRQWVRTIWRERSAASGAELRAETTGGSSAQITS